jgi:cobalt/nickel transport system permease protein
MLEEPFADGNSPLHRRDARVKIVAACVLTLVVALTTSFLVATGALAGACMLLFVARLPGRPVVKHVLAVNIFTLFLWLTLPCTYSSAHGTDSLMTFGPLVLSRDGIRLCALITLKSNALVLTLMALLSTSNIAGLGHGLEGLAVPPRLCFMLLSTYRYIFVIYQEYQRLQRAARMRGFVARTNLHTYKTYSYLLAMTLVKSWNRARRVHQAMLLRGFTGQIVVLRQPKLSGADYLFLLSISVFSATLWVLG